MLVQRTLSFTHPHAMHRRSIRPSAVGPLGSAVGASGLADTVKHVGAPNSLGAPSPAAPAPAACGLSRRGLLRALGLAGAGAAAGAATSGTLFSPGTLAWASEAADAGAAPDETVFWPCPSLVGAWPEDPTPADDFYAWVNKDWGRTTTLPDGYPTYGAADECQDRVRDDLIDLMRNPGPTHIEQLAADLFAAGLDQEARDAAGLDPLRPTIEAIMAAQTCEELAAVITASPLICCFSHIVNYYIGPDSRDPSVYRLSVGATALVLEDAAEYANPSEYSLLIQDAHRAHLAALLEHYGFDAAEAAAIADACLELEALLARDIDPLAEIYSEGYAERAYNPMSLAELEALCPHFPLVGFLRGAGMGDPEYVVVEQPQALAALEAAYVPQNLDLFKHYLVGDLLGSTCVYADAACADIRRAYRQARYGSEGKMPVEFEVFSTVNASSFGCELLSRIYAERFASEDACRDVRAMIEEVAASLQRRIQSRSWLSEQTRARAVEKLDAIVPLVGGAQKYVVDWDAVELSEGACFLQHAIDFCILGTCASIARADQPATKDTLLNKSAHEVNAYNGMAYNAIIITAAIMQPPFYDPAASRAANLGCLGVVIGHELTHAFDNQGAQYDKDGAVANWWTDEDFAAFGEHMDAVGRLFGSIEPIEGVSQRGELVASEAVADLGGFACCLDILLEEGASDDELRAFFECNAAMWRDIQTPECLAYLLGVDPHPSSYLRVDLVVQQFDEFYRLYGVTEGDRMYRAPEERLEVW